MLNVCKSGIITEQNIIEYNLLAEWYNTNIKTKVKSLHTDDVDINIISRADYDIFIDGIRKTIVYGSALHSSELPFNTQLYNIKYKSFPVLLPSKRCKLNKLQQLRSIKNFYEIKTKSEELNNLVKNQDISIEKDNKELVTIKTIEEIITEELKRNTIKFKTVNRNFTLQHKRFILVYETEIKETLITRLFNSFKNNQIKEINVDHFILDNLNCTLIIVNFTKRIYTTKYFVIGENIPIIKVFDKSNIRNLALIMKNFLKIE